jgi:hypothetical protein
MADKIRNDDTVLGFTLGCVNSFKARKILSSALDGTPYLQTTGEPDMKKSVTIWCESSEDRYNTDEASNTGALVSVEWKDKTFVGFIDGDIKWEQFRNENGAGEFTLLVKEVIE